MAGFDHTLLLIERRRRRRRHPDKPGIGYLPFPNLTRIHRIAQQASCQHCQRWRYRHEEGNFAPLPPDTPVVAADVPYGAGPSRLGSRIYIDPAIPATLPVGEVEIDLHHAIALHERVEYVLMHDFGMSYPDAHVIATAVEYNYVAQCGADVAEYERLVAPYVHQARSNAEQGGSDVPDDLDLTPYADEGETELVTDSMSAVAYGSRSKWQQDADRHDYTTVQDGDDLYAVQFDPAGQAIYVGWSPSSEVGYLDPNSGYPDRNSVRTSIRERWLGGRRRAECVFALSMLTAARALVGNPIEESAVKLTETAVQSYFKRAGMQVQMDGDHVTVWTATDKDYWDATQIYQGLGPQASELETVEDGDLFGIRFKLDQAEYPPNGDLASKPADYDNVPAVKPGENPMPENKPGKRLEATVHDEYMKVKPSSTVFFKRYAGKVGRVCTIKTKPDGVKLYQLEFDGRGGNEVWMADRDLEPSDEAEYNRLTYNKTEATGVVPAVDGERPAPAWTMTKAMRWASGLNTAQRRALQWASLAEDFWPTLEGLAKRVMTPENKDEAAIGGLEIMNRDDMMAFGGAGIPAAGPALIGYLEGGCAAVLALDDDGQIRVACEDVENGVPDENPEFFPDDADGYRAAKACILKIVSGKASAERAEAIGVNPASLVEASLTRRHFEDLAIDIRQGLASITPDGAVRVIAHEVADTLRGLNSKFDKDKFIALATRPLNGAAATFTGESYQRRMAGREVEASDLQVGDHVMFSDAVVMCDTLDGSLFVVTRLYRDGDVQFAKLRLDTEAAAVHLDRVD